jgi:hypothetical protein
MRRPDKTRLTPKERSDRLQQAMFTLVGNEAFATFIDELREQQHSAVMDSINDKVIANERLSLAAIGEIRAYEAIISTYEDFVQSRLAEADAENERRLG